jgi:hypothetical protein
MTTGRINQVSRRSFSLNLKFREEPKVKVQFETSKMNKNVLFRHMFCFPSDKINYRKKTNFSLKSSTPFPR